MDIDQHLHGKLLLLFFLNTMSKHHILSASNGCGIHMRIWDQCSTPNYKENQDVDGVEVEGSFPVVACADITYHYIVLCTPGQIS